MWKILIYDMKKKMIKDKQKQLKKKIMLMLSKDVYSKKTNFCHEVPTLTDSSPSMSVPRPSRAPRMEGSCLLPILDSFLF